MARAVTLCRQEVIAAYPISPQTHIVESLSDRVRTGELASCEYLMVESEFGAMSACIVPPERAPAPTPPRPARGCCSWPRRSSTPPASGCPS